MKLSDVIHKILESTTINRETFGLGKIPRYDVLTYWRYADVLCCIILLVINSFTYWMQPFQRQFYLNDITIQHPFAERERVNEAELFLYAFWIPAGVIVVLGLLMTTPKHKLYVTYVSLLGLTISVTATSATTDILKNFIGRHRPDFLARCIPKEGTPKDVLVYAKDVCTAKNLDRLMDGFRTTPSGHSSLSFAGLGYLSLWLAGQLIVFSNDSSGSWRSLVAFIPALGASLIALSRTEDYRHHFIDVLIGSTLGILFAIWSYRRLFPQLSHHKSYEPRLVIAQELKEQENYEALNDSGV